MIKPGNIVIVNFAGAQGSKHRPAVVISSSLYHTQRPDVILAPLTTNIAAARTQFDYRLEDWESAGLNQPSAFRTYFNMQLSDGLRSIGSLSDRDWLGAQTCLTLALQPT